jgi:hypothetical protein
MSMAYASETYSGEPDLIPLVVDGLRKSSTSAEQHYDEAHTKDTYTERILLPEDVPISALWAQLKCEWTLAFSATLIPGKTKLITFSSGL